MKKIVALVVTLPMFILFIVIGAFDDSEVIEKDIPNTCVYSETYIFDDEKVEQQRATVINNLVDTKYTNAVLGIYSLDTILDVKEISKQFNMFHEYAVMNNLDFDMSTYIQTYEYGEDYLKYLHEHNLVHTLNVSKEYQEKQETVTTEKNYSYYLKVLSAITDDCSMATTIDLENEHYQEKNPYVKSKLRGQCTWYVWGRVREKTGYELPSKMGNANAWYEYAKANKILNVGTTPKANSVMVLGSSDGLNEYGHVAIIESIENGKVRITEGNVNNPYFNDSQMSSYAHEHYAELFSDKEIDVSELTGGTYNQMKIIGYIYF